mmetsp:Transcript_7500/g.23246  ORF Transcript_7500/g.23246 Transcript_7500/m.23246 type:complete len:93 (-) Transcript_7500:945-1223(-)
MSGLEPSLHTWLMAVDPLISCQPHSASPIIPSLQAPKGATRAKGVRAAIGGSGDGGHADVAHFGFFAGREAQHRRNRIGWQLAHRIGAAACA